MRGRPSGNGQASDEALAATGITVRFEGLVALSDVTLSVRPKEIVGLIGPNGAGKTTLVNVLSGFQLPDSGEVTKDCAPVTGRAPHRLAREGLARTFQGVRLFGHLAVAENLDAAGVGIGLGLGEARQRRDGILRWMGMSDRAEQPAHALPHGDERRVGIARALTMRPRYLLLDEPAAGLNDAECDDLMELLKRIPGEFDCGVLLIEHNIRVVMGVCARICVLDSGRLIAEGPPQQVQTDPDVIRAYLGSGGADRA